MPPVRTSSHTISFRNRNNISDVTRFLEPPVTLQLRSQSTSPHNLISFGPSSLVKLALLLCTLFLVFRLLPSRINDDGPTLLLRIQRYAPHANILDTISRERFTSGENSNGVFNKDLNNYISASVLGSTQLINGNQGRRKSPQLHDASSTSITSPSEVDSPVTSSPSHQRVVILSHELSITGAPRVCTELAQVLGNLGVATTLSTLSMLDSNKWLTRTDAQTVANLLPSLTPNYFSFTLHRGYRDGSLSELVWNADVVIVSTAVIASSEFVSQFAVTTLRHGKLIWWIHESESVMTALGESSLVSALEALSILGHQSESRDTVIFPSRAAVSFWVTAALRLPEIQKSSALSVINAAKIVLWGLPSWKLSALRFDGREAEADRERDRIRLELGMRKDDIVFLSLGTLHALKGHAGIVRAIRCAASNRGGSADQGGETKKGEVTPMFPRLVLVAVGGGFCADHLHFPFSNCKVVYKGTTPLSAPTPCSDLKKEGDFEEELDDMSWVLQEESFHFLPAARRIEPYFSMADVFVSNTLGGGETWGLAMLEAMGARLPVLAAARGGSLEMVVDGETGLLHRDEFELVENIRKISDDAEFRCRLGAGAGKRVTEKFGDEHVVKSVEDVVFR
jgi:glycosyltransferase involved in cell wall biosynthesis